MPTPHNEAKKEDIAKTVIMPGDPLRAKYIAEHYLQDYKLVNKVRGMYAYTGNYKGKRITVMAHGMGNPSVGIYSYELFNDYDVDEIIRVGSCGAVSKDLKLNQVLIAKKVFTQSNFALVQSGSEDKKIYSNAELNDKIVMCAKDLEIELENAYIYNSDAFYSYMQDPIRIFNEYGCVAIEMEAFALLWMAKIFNKKATCLLTVSDNIVTKKELSSEERQNGFDTMIKLALESIVR